MRKRMNFYGFFSPADTADLRRGFFKPQIALITQIFNKLQILQITQIEFLMRKRMNFYGFFSPADCADLRRGFFKPQIALITLIFNKLQILQI